MLTPTTAWSLLLLVIGLAYTLFRQLVDRRKLIPPHQERVLILGASSGIGRGIARIYSARGAHVCVVARRKDKLEQVRNECIKLASSKDFIASYVADFSDAESLLRVREFLRSEWEGLDTVIITAGVSALRPLLEVAGIEDRTSQVDLQGLHHIHKVASSAIEGNFTGPLLAAVTYLPFLSNTSISPSILLLSSVAAVIPAPTRSLYAASKAAALLLFQALSMEHPKVHFSHVLPFTVKGDFRSSAVDGPIIDPEASQKGLDIMYVANACVNAVDRYKTHVWLPGFLQIAPAAYWSLPSLIQWLARKKYNVK